MTRDAFLARVSDLLRRTGVEDADALVEQLERWMLDQDAADAFAAVRSIYTAPAYIQIVERDGRRKYSVGTIQNTLHGPHFTAQFVTGADL